MTTQATIDFCIVRDAEIEALLKARIYPCNPRAAARVGYEAGLAHARQELEPARKLTAQQAEDEGLWFQAQYASEAYLQQALRELHSVIEQAKGE